jgi:circadian clock protein KaiC
VLRKVMAVVKMRGSDHSKELRSYNVGEHGVIVGEALTDYTGIITGVARRREDLGERRPDQASSS